MSEEQANEVSIQDLELSLQVYEIEAQDKLKKLQALFTEKQKVDLTKMFYEERSALEIKFQNIVSDLSEFLIKQEIASTDKLRKTFYLILENPLTFLFKVSRFEIFNLRLNAFDIELEPIDAVAELATALLRNIDAHTKLAGNVPQRYTGGEYTSYQQFLEDAQIHLIQDQIFLFYSYLRKGGKFIRKQFEHKVRVVQLYSKIQEKLLKSSIQTNDVKTLKELSVLNYEIYLLENSYDVLCFYLKVPLKAVFADTFKQLQTLGAKARQNSNYDLFILIFLRYSKEILGKLAAEGIDPVFKGYIEQALVGLLQLWGCRLCYYQQFFDLFCQLLALHPAPAEALLLCLQFNPTLQKDDIVLLRTNFKHDLQQKQSELLSLLRPKSMEDINKALSQYYHRTLYNLDFAQHSRTQLLELINLVNGNASVGQFFAVAERAFREWNHTVDFTNPHKFIEGEFKYPTLEQPKLIQSLRLLNNLCLLQAKEVKEYEQLVKAGSIQKAFIGFCAFLLTNPQAKELTATHPLPKLFLTNALKFLKKAIIASADWEAACLLFSAQLAPLGLPHVPEAITTILEIVKENYNAFTVKKLANIFKNVIALEQQFSLDSSASLDTFLGSFMAGTQKQNQQIRMFRLFDSRTSASTKITAAEQAFLKKYACLNGDILQPKQTACFILSELQIVTNPVQFDKVIDNYYFNLDNNAKKFVQRLCLDWQTALSQQQINANLAIAAQLILRYPIAIPLLCSTRVSYGTASKRFVELLAASVNRQSFGLLKAIVQCRSIRFKNGRDYVREEILPVILKETLRVINEGNHKVEHFQLLALTLAHSKTHDIKLDLIQQAIESIKYQLSESNNQEEAYRLSQAIYAILTKYFEKKEVDMRKRGLVALFHQQVWSEMRTKTQPLQNQNSKQQLQKVKIPDQIMITPYIVSPEFETEEVKLEKLKTAPVESKLETAEIDLASVKLPNKAAPTNVFSDKKAETETTVDLSKLKYNIESHLGLEIRQFCRKEGFKILTCSPDTAQSSQNNDQNTTLVQYYLKQFQNPQISAELVLKYLLALLNKKVTFCSLFSNYSNLQKLFSSLILLLTHFSKTNIAAPTASNTTEEQLLVTGSADKTQTIKTILNIFSEIGYTNLWAESFNSLKNVDYLKELKTKTEFKQEDQQQTFFSWMLKVTLQNPNVKEELNLLLEKIFLSRPKQQNSLMYKVTINRGLLNLIMQSLQIHNLSYVSLLFHSNYNNLRLYTDQLHEGLKALNIASKNRAYNEYIQLSKDIEDEQFYTPLKLFKENFSFFIKIEKEGYRFKRSQEEKLGRERVLKVLRSGATGDDLNKQIEQVVQDFQVQLDKLQYNIASRVKSFYLVTKLRDLSYQNSLTVCLLHEILFDNKVPTEQRLEHINKVEIFSLMMELYNKLVRFDKPQNCENFLLLDRFITEKEVNICSMRRYSFAMNKIYDKCELEFDEVLQRSVDALKSFLASKQGAQWISTIHVYPPFLSKSFVSYTASDALVTTIRTNIGKTLQSFNSIELAAEPDSFSNLVKSLRQLKKGHLLSKDKVKVKFNGKLLTLSDFLPALQAHLVSSQTLRKSKDGYWLFNRYKTSEKTLQEIELLGLLVGYCLFNEIEIDLPLHSSLLAAVGFGVCDLQDLLEVDFKVWEDLRNVMSVTDSKDLNLNFSYLFESLQTLKPERVELLDKGTSKKVNNLNREDYCDLVCCYLLYRSVAKQVARFLEGIVYLCPKELLSSLRVADLHRFFLKKSPAYSQTIIKQLMRKRGLVQPQSVLVGGKRVQNLKDYQSIQWLCEIIQQNAQLRDKLWPLESNLVVCTWMGQEVQFQPEIRRLLLGRVASKEELNQALLRFK